MNRILLLALLFSGILFSCEKEVIEPTPEIITEPITGEEPTVKNTPNLLNFYLTDAPFDAQEVNVEILSVLIKGDGDEVELTTISGIYNLLDFQNGVDTLIAADSIPFTNISQIRLMLGDDNTIKVDDEIYPLTIPSGSQTGLKLLVNFDLDSTDVTEILVDFDVCESIKRKGNGDYFMKPVLKFKGDRNNHDDDDDDDNGNNGNLIEKVIDYLTLNYPDATVIKAKKIKYCDEDFVTVKLDTDTGEIYLVLDANADVILVFTGVEIQSVDLPAAATDLLAADYADFYVDDIALELTDTLGVISYLVNLENDQGEELILVISETGDLVCESKDDDDDDDLQLSTTITDYISANYPDATIDEAKNITFCNTDLTEVKLEEDNEDFSLFFDTANVFLMSGLKAKTKDLPTAVSDLLDANYSDKNIAQNSLELTDIDGTIPYWVEAKARGNAPDVNVVISDAGDLICEF